MKLEKLMPGMVVYDVARQRMGNTTMSSICVWRVRIVSVDLTNRRVTASWNGNAAQTFYEGKASKWREKEPLVIRHGMGYARLANREEIKAAKMAKAGAATT